MSTTDKMDETALPSKEDSAAPAPTELAAEPLPEPVETPVPAPSEKVETEPEERAAPQPVETTIHSLPETEDGVEHSLKILRFGQEEARPKVYIQAGLHADELPGRLVLRYLAQQLEEAAAYGELIGQIVLVPIANPIGLKQVEGGYMQGRTEKSSGRNFNRGFPDLAALARRRVVGKFDTEDAQKNIDKIRRGMNLGLEALEPADTFEALQTTLISEACDADIVLDLHADNEALMHLYTLPNFWPEAKDLAAEIDARAVLLCDDSGGGTFDEACSRPWATLAAKQDDAAIPMACFSATVELRSNNEVDPREAKRDARALYKFLIRRGAIKGEVGNLPRLLCDASDLRAMQQVKAPCEGLVVYRLRLGDTVRIGDTIAEIYPSEGDPEPVAATTEGVLFARHNQTWAWEGKVIAKVAGQTPLPNPDTALLTD